MSRKKKIKLSTVTIRPEADNKQFYKTVRNIFKYKAKNVRDKMKKMGVK